MCIYLLIQINKKINIKVCCGCICKYDVDICKYTNFDRSVGTRIYNRFNEK